MATKNRILYLMKYLQEHSDEEHPVSTAEIREEMARQGYPLLIPTLRDDIASLQHAGYDIQINEREGLPTTYSWLDRAWDLPELQILVDAVSSSQFLTVDMSRRLIGKLSDMAVESARESLSPRILVSEHVKAPNTQILYSVQAIRGAMDLDRKISFNYMRYNMDKKQVPRYAGTPKEIYAVSPYATIWNNERYYMIGYSDRDGEVRTYRVDRMTNVKEMEERRVPQPEDFNIQDYTDKVFWMYGGRESKVTLRCEQSLLDQVIDKFGRDIVIENIQEEIRGIQPATFDVTVPVCISGTFYAWIVQFGKQMMIVKPVEIKDAFADYLMDCIETSLG